MPRFHCPMPLQSGSSLDLPPGTARHVQVLRLQPGARITLFNGAGGEFEAAVEHMGRSDVRVRVLSHLDVEREAKRQVHLSVGMPANERMDWLVEKATELGAASIQPLLAERSVLRLTGERAEKKTAHWQAIAIAACEQCGRNRVPPVREVLSFDAWLSQAPRPGPRWMLTLAPGATPLSITPDPSGALTLLSGPEGGLSAAEEARARAVGFLPHTLGPRVLRAETAPLAALSRMLCEVI
jgi:16S rRNA (uracil1498-N3)-methyltransferase